MQNKLRLASLLGVGFLMLIPIPTVAQTAPLPKDAKNLQQAQQVASKQITGIIEAVNGTSFTVRLADGTTKTYPVNEQIFSPLKLIQGIAIIFDPDSSSEVSSKEQPNQAFNGRIINIQDTQLTVMLTSGQVRTIPIQPKFATQLRKLQQLRSVQVPITGIVHDSHPLSDIDHSPSTATTALTPQMTTRRSQVRDEKATYSDLISACKNREAEVNKLKALQDVANNVIRFARIETVDINNLLKGQNVQAFQQQCAKATSAQQATMRDILTDAKVIVRNTNQIMTLEQALLMSKVKSESIVGLKVTDIYQGRVFVFYDSTI